ncbi:hypothetical protein A4A49_63120, partial [Nicotiana attenuata]
MAGKKSCSRPKKEQIKVDDKIPKLKTTGGSSSAVMESISGAPKTQVGSGILTQIPYVGASALASQQQKQANQSPIPLHVDLRGSVTPPISRVATVSLSSKEQEVATQAPSPAPVTVTLPEEPKESTWAGLFTGNRSSANGMALNYITPKLVEGNLVAKLEKSELEKKALKWKRALIINVIGEKPGYNYMRRYINQILNAEGVKQDQQPRKKRPQPVKQIWRTTGAVLASTSGNGQEQAVIPSKEPGTAPNKSEDIVEDQMSEEGLQRQMAKGKIAVEISGVPMNYAKAVLTHGKHRPSQQSSVAVLANLKPPSTGG